MISFSLVCLLIAPIVLCERLKLNNVISYRVKIKGLEMANKWVEWNLLKKEEVVIDLF